MAVINFSSNVGSKVKPINPSSQDTFSKQHVNSILTPTINVKENNLSKNDFYQKQLEQVLKKFKDVELAILKKQNTRNELEMTILEKQNIISKLDKTIFERSNTLTSENTNYPNKAISFVERFKMLLNIFYKK